MQTLVLLSAFCCPCATHAQNWVPNHGFEETDSCTFGLGLGALHNWYSACGTPDYLQSCQPYGTANGLPLNIFTYQQPWQGNSCAGICTFDDDTGLEYREWLMVPLLSPMVPGQSYFCRFWANAAFGGNSINQTTWLASDHLGMLFTTYDRQWTWGDDLPTAMNQAHILNSQILSDTANWTLVSGSFVADSAYTYVMIGNFYDNALVDTLHFAVLDPDWDVYGYTLIDGVCVSSSPESCDLSFGLQEMGQTVPTVYPNPSSDVLVIGNAIGSDVRVLDMMGQRVWSGRVDRDFFAVDVKSWAPGAYIVRLHEARGARVLTFVLTE